MTTLFHLIVFASTMFIITKNTIHTFNQHQQKDIVLSKQCILDIFITFVFTFLHYNDISFLIALASDICYFTIMYSDRKMFDNVFPNLSFMAVCMNCLYLHSLTLKPVLHDAPQPMMTYSSLAYNTLHA